MAVTALVTVLAVPLALGGAMLLAGPTPVAVTRPAAVVDAPRPAAAAPGPPAPDPPPPQPAPNSAPGPWPAPGSGPTPGPTPGPAVGYTWPLEPRPPVVRPFAPGPERWSAGHRGVDLRGQPDQPVLAAAPGRVVLAVAVGGVPVVVVLHPDGTRTTYEPVRASVRRGDVVRAGQPLGTLVTTGSHCFPETCLHWGALRGSAYLDPVVLIARRGPPVLLPFSLPVGLPAGRSRRPGRVATA